MIAISALIQLLKPFTCHFEATHYGAFREQVDSTVAHRPVRTFQMRGEVLITDEHFQVVGKIAAPSMDDWGKANNAQYLLPLGKVRINVIQRLRLRAKPLLALLLESFKSKNQFGNNVVGKKRNGSKKPACERRRNSHAVSWTTLRLAG